MTDDDTETSSPRGPCTSPPAPASAPFAGWSMPLTYPPGVHEGASARARACRPVRHLAHEAVRGLRDRVRRHSDRRACPLDAGALRISPVQIHASSSTSRRHHRRPHRHQARRRALHGRRQCRQCRRATMAHLRELAAGFDVQGRARSTASSWRIQGPEAWAALAAQPASTTGVAAFMHGIEPRPRWFMSRSGYTGEDGFEIGLPEADARDLRRQAARRRPRHVDRARRARQPAPRGRTLPARPGHHARDRSGQLPA